MIKKVIFSIILFFSFFNCFALTSEYKDAVSEITGYEPSNNLTIYFFHSSTCHHCQAESKWFQTLKKEYPNIDIVYYEISNNTNSIYYEKVIEKLNIPRKVVPIVVISDEYFIGFSDSISKDIENCINKYLSGEENNNKYIPFLKDVNVLEVSIGLVAIILGFIDGFNPCAMWILLFLINMLIGLKNKKRRIILGIVFLLTSGFIYFLSMLGINLILDFTTINLIRYLIGIIGIGLGIINLINYIKDLKDKDIGCHVVSQKKRKVIIERIKKISHEKSFFLALFGIIILASLVNLIEMACSLGFPLIFTEILSLNKITGISRILYLLLYITFYLLDDIIIFIIAMKTFEIKSFSTKYSKYSKLIGGILMILIGILMIFKYEWLTMTF